MQNSRAAAIIPERPEEDERKNTQRSGDFPCGSIRFPGARTRRFHRKFTKILCQPNLWRLYFSADPAILNSRVQERKEAVTMVKFGRLVFDDVDDLIFSDTELIRSER